jgi:hypothetical protein
MAMKNTLTDRYVATVIAPGHEQGRGGAVEAYRGWQPCVNWCIEQFGTGSTRAWAWRYVGEGVFEFEREQDRTCFLLKWA